MKIKKFLKVKSYEDEYILVQEISTDTCHYVRDSLKIKEVSILNDGKIPFIFNEYVYISGMTIKEAKNYLISIAKEEQLTRK